MRLVAQRRLADRRSKSTWRGAVTAALAATVAALAPSAEAAPQMRATGLLPQRAALVQKVAVFGTDERVAVPERYLKAADSVGLFFSNPSRTVCTAFCVAPNVIATAAHCLAQPNGKPARLADFVFARGYDRLRDYARVEGHEAGSTAQSAIIGDFQHRVRPPIDATNDWALVRLNRPACISGGLPVTPMSATELIGEAKAGHVFQLSYHRDWTQWRIAYSRPCAVSRDFKEAAWTAIAPDFLSAEQLVLHQCDTGGASSGSPLLLERGNMVSVIAINVGTYVQSKILTERGQVTLREKAETVANTAVNAGVFASRIEPLRTASMLSTGQPMRDLQQRLSEQRFYQARIDGSYGPLLKTAIESFERASRLPVTGLPTLELLRQLNARSTGLGQVSPTSAPTGPQGAATGR